MVIFRKIVIIFLGRNTPNNKLFDYKQETVKVIWLLKSIYYELGAINHYLEGAVISVSTIC